MSRDLSKRLLNVGGNNKSIAIPPYYAEFEHLLLDVDKTVKPDVLADARSLHTLDADQYDAVYCSHNLEHYFAHDVTKVLAGFRHVLKQGGFAEIRVPDTKALMRHMVENDIELDEVLYNTQAGHPISCCDILYGWGQQIERSGVDFYAHKTGFSQNTLRKALNNAGFAVVVFRPGRIFEVRALAFTVMPVSEYQKLLGLNLDI